MTYQGWFWEIPKLASGVRNENGFVWTLPSNFIVGPHLFVVGIRNLGQTLRSGGFNFSLANST